jgi:hypothetical protein
LSEATENRQEIADLKRSPGKLSFEAHIGPASRRIWFRTETETLPAVEAALAASLLPAMQFGGELRIDEPLSPRAMHGQREFQALRRTAHEVEVIAPARPVEPSMAEGRVAAIFDGSVGSWVTVLSDPDVTDLILVEDFGERGAAAKADLRVAAAELGLGLHLVRTNLRELSDPLVPWDAYRGCAETAVAFLFEPIVDRVLIAADLDYELQEKLGAEPIASHLWSTESLDLVDAGGRLDGVERIRRVAEHPVARRFLPADDPMTAVALEAMGLREEVATTPSKIDLEAVASLEISEPIERAHWEDVLDAARAGGRVDLERAIEAPVQRAKRTQGLPPAFRDRSDLGPRPSVRVVVIVPVWKAARYMAGAVASALAQEAPFGVGVVIVDDGCPEPETARIGQALHDANPDRVEFLRQANAGVSAARNAGIRRAIRRWPDVEGFFFLDADNLLSPQTMAEAWQLLEEEPRLTWASPALEMFGIREGVWNVVGPHLTYHQLFANQSDTGTLTRRTVFDAGLEFDETMRKGFEDWEFFLRAGLAGFAGAGAGRCGFRYRTLPDSMLVGTQRREEEVKADIRERNADAYRAGALCRREHAEAPRFALVRCDRADALLLAAADLEPRRVPLAALCAEEQPASVIVLANTEEIESLREQQLLAGVLLRLQLALHDHQGITLEAAGKTIAAAATPAALGWLRQSDGVLWTDHALDLAGAEPAAPVTPWGDRFFEILDCVCSVPERPERVLGAAPHGRFFQAQHLGQLETTVPWAGVEGGRTLLALAPTSGGVGWDEMLARVAEARAARSDLAAHLVLTGTPLRADPPPAGFDTLTCLGGADPTAVAMLVERLRAGADLVEELVGVPESTPASERISA